MSADTAPPTTAPSTSPTLRCTGRVRRCSRRHQTTTSPDAAKLTTAFLVDMIRPAFPKGMSESNVGAMLKRCNVALNTKEEFFFRPAGKDSVVEKLPLMSSYITAEAGQTLMRFLKHKKRRDQEEYDRLLAFEKKEMLQLMAESRGRRRRGWSRRGGQRDGARSKRR